MSTKPPFFAAALSAFVLINGDAVAGSVTIGFEGMTDNALYGKSNVEGNCVGFYNCYTEGGMVFGTPIDASSPFAHVHKAYDFISFNTGLEYHGDSAGIYVRAGDLSAFNLESMRVRDISGTAGTTFQVVGFSEAYNPAIVGSIGPFAGQVAGDVITENGVKMFDTSFDDIKAFWVFYDGYPATPADGTNWNIVLDDIVITTVPLPAAAWLMGGALFSLLAGGVRRPRPTKGTTATLGLSHQSRT